MQIPTINANTLLHGIEVDSEVVLAFKLDDDGDGVHNLNDLCPSTPIGEVVSSTGCTVKTNDDRKIY